MAGEWRETTLNQLGRIVTGKTPSSNRSDCFGGMVPFVTPTDLDGRRIIDSTGRYLTEDGVKSVASLIPARTVMVSCIGSDMGKAAIAGRECVTNQQINSIVVTSRDDPLFVYYNLSGRKAEIQGVAAGSAQPILNKTAFGLLDIRLPPPEEQRAIAHILGTLDDKIELNRRRNATLEAMVRALFKAWFVDFEPVRAKLEGRWHHGQSLPGLPARLYDLFPDRLVDSDLGEIPEGWEEAEIGNIAEVIDCLHSKKPDRTEEGLPLLQLANIRDDGLLDMTDTYLVSGGDYEKWIARMEASPGDCVITNVGRVGAVAQIPPQQKAALGRNMTGVRCSAEFPFPTFLIECLLSQAMKEEIKRKTDTGTILNALNVRNIPRLRFVRGPEKTVAAFEQEARPLRARMEQLFAEARTLAALRGTLLPKLISGELRAKDVGRIADEVPA